MAGVCSRVADADRSALDSGEADGSTGGNQTAHSIPDGEPGLVTFAGGASCAHSS